MPDRPRQRDQRRGPRWIDARVYVRRRRARRGQPLAGRRSGDGATDAVFLSWHVERKSAPGCGLARGANRDVEKLALVVALLLGGVCYARRVAVIKVPPKNPRHAFENRYNSSLNNFS